MLKLNNALHGHWLVEAGVPQGGALSLCLFVVVLLSLARDIRRANCGIQFANDANEQIITPMLAFVDDVTLMADSPYHLQEGINALAA